MNLNYNGLCESKLYSFILLNKYLNQCNACLFSYKGAQGDETKGRPVMIDHWSLISLVYTADLQKLTKQKQIVNFT